MRLLIFTLLQLMNLLSEKSILFHVLKTLILKLFLRIIKRLELFRRTETLSHMRILKLFL
jgi:hypothetical protein